MNHMEEVAKMFGKKLGKFFLSNLYVTETLLGVITLRLMGYFVKIEALAKQCLITYSQARR